VQKKMDIEEGENGTVTLHVYVRTRLTA